MVLRLLQRMQRYETRTLTVGAIKYRALVADSLIKRMLGLMFSERLPPKTCMLISLYENYNGIWMRNMRFGIDVVWLDQEMRVVGIAERLRPCKSIFECRTYYPDKPAKYVVEFSAGTVKREKINYRTKIRF